MGCSGASGFRSLLGATLTVLYATSALVGCKGGGSTVDGGREASVPFSPCDAGDQQQLAEFAQSGTTYVYVLSETIVDEVPTDAQSRLYGFNLDGIHTAEDGSTPLSCGKPDQPSWFDDEQNCPEHATDPMSGRCVSCQLGCRAGVGCRGGVDNQWPNVVEVVGTALSMTFPAGIRPVIRAMDRVGTQPLVVVVRGVDSFEDDDQVEVSIFDAVQTFSDHCEFVLPDREYAIRSDSVTDAASMRSRYGVMRGSIRRGRLRAQGDLMPAFLPVDRVHAPYRFAMQRARFNVDLQRNEGRRGNAGALIAGQNALEYLLALTRTVGIGIDLLQIYGFVGGLLDLQSPVPDARTEMSGVCVDRSDVNNPMFGNMGVGFGFSLVSARLAPTLATERAPRACQGVISYGPNGEILLPPVPADGDAGDAAVADVRTDANVGADVTADVDADADADADVGGDVVSVDATADGMEQ